ncbi:hypothetical protein LF1_53260 [Rubripirellula obstinata]|uniref:Uncharacterized protein n=1 Tax=Rubripirellula obstinata TaxID=406547 RepID=A0A5B1C8P1_9BACT|nr:hypothetical protein LF1_53260 [Rubripirellula obstinata]
MVSATQCIRHTGVVRALKFRRRLMPRRAVGTSMLSSAGGKAVWGVRWLCPAGREEGINCPRHSRITVCITEVAGLDVQAEKKACGRHSGACNGYPQNTIAMRSVSADFVPVGDKHPFQIVAKFRWSSKFRRGAANRATKDRRWFMPRSASDASALIEYWDSGVG